MKAFSFQVFKGLLALWTFAAATPAWALLTCSITSPSVDYAYVVRPVGAPLNYVVQSSVTATCTRTSTADPTDLALEVNDGMYRAGNTNKARLTVGGVNYDLNYEFYRNSLCTSRWAKGSNRIAATLGSTALNTPTQVSFNFWTCLPANQLTTSAPSGTYMDSATLVLVSGNTVLATNASISLHVSAPAFCAISQPPSNILFHYTAFSPQAVFAGTNFIASCSHQLPYTVSLSPTSGVVAGLRYVLGLTAGSVGSANSIGASTLQAVGNASGLATHFINGAMDAGQAGAAGTVVPQVHTLTITY